MYTLYGIYIIYRLYVVYIIYIVYVCGLIKRKVMEEQLISFETAKLAKEKGFNWKCYNYDGNQDVVRSLVNSYVRDILWLPAPTQSLLQKWLREEYDIHLAVEPFCDGTFDCNIYWDDYDGEEDTEVEYRTYEGALESGLIYALKLIKE